MKKSIKTVGFADLSSLKLLRQSGLSQEEIIDHVQKFYEECGNFIVNHGGKIINYHGDDIMFLFDNAKDAYSASKEMNEYYRNNMSVNKSKLVTVLITGEIYTGEFGHKSLRLFSVFGNIMNKSYILRREAGENPDGIAYCEETKKLL